MPPRSKLRLYSRKRKPSFQRSQLARQRKGGDTPQPEVEPVEEANLRHSLADPGTMSSTAIKTAQRAYGNQFVQRLALGTEVRGTRAPLSLQRAGAGSANVSNGIEERIETQRGTGQALPKDTQSQMGESFGADFGGVRVHTGAESNQLNRSLNARAFTTGNDIFFADNEYNPNSSGGQELIAHELTHVVQQGAAPAKPVQTAAIEEEDQEAVRTKPAKAIQRSETPDPAANAPLAEAQQLAENPQAALETGEAKPGADSGQPPAQQKQAEKVEQGAGEMKEKGEKEAAARQDSATKAEESLASVNKSAAGAADPKGMMEKVAGGELGGGGAASPGGLADLSDLSSPAVPALLMEPAPPALHTEAEQELTEDQAALNAEARFGSLNTDKSQLPEWHTELAMHDAFANVGSLGGLGDAEGQVQKKAASLQRAGAVGGASGGSPASATTPAAPVRRDWEPRPAFYIHEPKIDTGNEFGNTVVNGATGLGIGMSFGPGLKAINSIGALTEEISPFGVMARVMETAINITELISNIFTAISLALLVVTIILGIVWLVLTVIASILMGVAMLLMSVGGALIAVGGALQAIPIIGNAIGAALISAGNAMVSASWSVGAASAKVTAVVAKVSAAIAKVRAAAAKVDIVALKLVALRLQMRLVAFILRGLDAAYAAAVLGPDAAKKRAFLMSDQVFGAIGDASSLAMPKLGAKIGGIEATGKAGKFFVTAGSKLLPKVLGLGITVGSGATKWGLIEKLGNRTEFEQQERDRLGVNQIRMMPDVHRAGDEEGAAKVELPPPPLEAEQKAQETALNLGDAQAEKTMVQERLAAIEAALGVKQYWGAEMEASQGAHNSNLQILGAQQQEADQHLKAEDDFAKLAGRGSGQADKAKEKGLESSQSMAEAHGPVKDASHDAGKSHDKGAHDTPDSASSQGEMHKSESSTHQAGAVIDNGAGLADQSRAKTEAVQQQNAEDRQATLAAKEQMAQSQDLNQSELELLRTERENCLTRLAAIAAEEAAIQNEHDQARSQTEAWVTAHRAVREGQLAPALRQQMGDEQYDEFEAQVEASVPTE